MKSLFVTLTASLFAFTIHSQVIFQESFSNLIFVNGWSVIDANSDNNNWQVLNVAQYPPFQSQGYVILSASKIPGQTGYSPNDFIITPNIDLTAASGNVNFTFKVGSDQTTASGNYQDFLSVYVVTDASLSNLLASTPIHSQVLTGGQTMFSFTYNINSFIGSNIKIAFRHHNCTDEGTVYVDDIKVEQFPAGNLTTQCPPNQNWNAIDNGTTLTSLEPFGVYSTTCTGVYTYSQSPAIGTPLVQGANNVNITITDNCGNSQTCQTVVNYVNNASVSDLEEDVIKIAPNPTNGTINLINIDFPISKIDLTNIDGKVIKSIYSNFEKIDINEIVSGEYFLNIQTDKKVIVKKIIVQ